VQALYYLKKAADDFSRACCIADMEQADEVAIYVNPAFEQLTGYSSGEILGKNFRLLQGPLSSVQATARLRNAIRAHKAIHQDLINYHKDGSSFWNRMVLLPVQEQGHLYYFGIQQDIAGLSRMNQPGRAVKAISTSEFSQVISNGLTTLLNVHLLLEEAKTEEQKKTLIQQISVSLLRIEGCVESLEFKP